MFVILQVPYALTPVRHNVISIHPIRHIKFTSLRIIGSWTRRYGFFIRCIADAIGDLQAAPHSARNGSCEIGP